MFKPQQNVAEFSGAAEKKERSVVKLVLCSDVKSLNFGFDKENVVGFNDLV